MTGLIMRLTLQQLAGQKRSVLVLLLAALPAVLAVVFRFSAPDHASAQEFTARLLFSGLVVATVLPLAAVVFGTAALGAEIEDGTVVYLLAKPIARREIVAGKFLGAWLVTAAVAVASTVIAGGIALYGEDEQGLLAAFAIATVLGAGLYTMLFIALSIFTSRALIAGLVYVFLWEGLVTRLFSGTRILSVRQYTLGIADALSSTTRDTFSAELSGVSAVSGLIAAGAVVTFLAIRLLQRWEIGESG